MIRGSFDSDEATKSAAGFVIHLVVALSMALTVASCTGPGSESIAPVFYSARNSNRDDVLRKQAVWKFLFRSIDEASSSVGLGELRQKADQPGTFEIRIWRGFGGTSLQGFVLRWDGREWRGLRISEIPYHAMERAYEAQSLVPRSGWRHFWMLLHEQSILTLPDSAELAGDTPAIEDGGGYQIEIRTASAYRTYGYMDIEHQSVPEAQRMLRIQEILDRELAGR